MARLILVRHGHTGLNLPGPDERLRAWLDLPLDERGMAEATEIAEHVAAYQIEAIYCSDLRRARQTAEIIRKRTKERMMPTIALRPWNLGVFAGHKVNDILPFLDLLNRNPDLRAPGGESFYEFYGRYSSRLVYLLNLADESRSDIVAVTHVRNLLATATILNDGDPATVPVKGGPPTGTLIIVEKQNDRWVVRTENSKSHPAPLPEGTTAWKRAGFDQIPTVLS